MMSPKPFKLDVTTHSWLDDDIDMLVSMATVNKQLERSMADIGHVPVRRYAGNELVIVVDPFYK